MKTIDAVPAGPGPALTVRRVAPHEVAGFDAQLAAHHYLGAGRPVGDYLRQIVESEGRAVALLVWGPSCYALKDRDLWISWRATQRVERLKLVVQNRRFLVLAAKGQSPNLASQSLGAALRALPEQWRAQFGCRPLPAESFTDPEAYAGTCYKASNWEPVGFSAGYSRHRADFYVANERPKKLWLRELAPQARAALRAPQVPEDSRAGLRAPPSGVLPVTQPQMLSLLAVWRRAPDPRAANKHYRIGPVLTLVALGLLAGRREIAELARFATTLTQAQRRHLGLPRKAGMRAFYQVPGYGVFYQVLTRLNPEPFAALLSAWLRERAGTRPQALALDGKMIRDHIGLLTSATVSGRWWRKCRRRSATCSTQGKSTSSGVAARAQHAHFPSAFVDLTPARQMRRRVPRGKNASAALRPIFQCWPARWADCL